MTEEVAYVDGTTAVAATWLNAMQDIISGLAHNFVLAKASSTSVKVTAGTGNSTVGVVINGKLRYATVTKTLTISGVAGTKDVYATAETSDRDFALEFGASGYTPTAVNYRYIGKVVWDGAAITGDATNLAGPAPTDSPILTGTPTAPTATSGDNSQTLATTAFVKSQAYATLASPALTGTPTAPTAAVDTNTTQIATTAFVIGQAYAKIASPTFTGTPAAPTAAVDTNTTQVATTAFVIGQSYAKLASPTFTGTPAAPTAAVDTSTTQLATTAFVIGQAYAKLASPTFSGTPTLPTGTIAVTQVGSDNSTKIATTAFVQGQGYATLASPTFTGTPAAPTAAVDTNTTQVATTAYVIGQAYAKLASPTFSGTPSLPTGTTGVTQTSSDNSTKLATTAFVKAQAYATLASPTFTGNTAISSSLALTPGTIQTASYTVTTAMDVLQPIDTVTNAVAATLPSAPLSGQMFVIYDQTGHAATHNVTISRNAKNINGAAADLTISNNFGGWVLYYDGGTIGWIATPTNVAIAATYAPLASPALTGTPTSTTAAVDTNTTQVATTAFVIGQAYAKLASPTFTGTPAAPTAAVDTNTTQVATTAFVIGQAYAKLASPTFTGTPAAPTAAANTNTTQIATTAFVIGQAYATLASPTFTGTPAAPVGSYSASAGFTTQVATWQWIATNASMMFPVRCATTGALAANTYSSTGNGSLTASANGVIATVDGVTLAVNDRILVKNEVTTANNGVYTVTSVGSAGSTYVLTRASDMIHGTVDYPYIAVPVYQGTTNGAKVWYQVTIGGGTAGAFTVGSDGGSWVQVLAALASPTFTGTPAAPTAAVDTNTTQLATTAFVIGQAYAKLASPTFTGTPAAPTAAANTNTTQIATTAFVIGQAYAADNAVVHLAGAESVTGVKTFSAAPVQAIQAFTATGSILSTGGSIVTFTGAAAQTLTLPAAVVGMEIYVRNIDATNPVTISRAGADTVNGQTTLILRPGVGVTFTCSAAAKWTTDAVSGLIIGTRANRPAATAVPSGTTYAETDSSVVAPYASGANQPLGVVNISDGSNWLYEDAPAPYYRYKSLPAIDRPYMVTHPGHTTSGLVYTLSAGSVFMFGLGDIWNQGGSLASPTLTASNTNYVWALPSDGGIGDGYVRGVTLTANTTGVAPSSANYGPGGVPSSCILVAVCVTGVSTVTSVTDAPGGIVDTGVTLAESTLASVSAGAGDKLSVTVWGDGVTPVRLFFSGTITSDSATTGVQIILRDGASGTGTIYAAVYGITAAANSNINAACNSKKIAAWAGNKTFYANLNNGAGTPKLYGLSDNAPASLTAIAA